MTTTLKALIHRIDEAADSLGDVEQTLSLLSDFDLLKAKHLQQTALAVEKIEKIADDAIDKLPSPPSPVKFVEKQRNMRKFPG